MTYTQTLTRAATALAVSLALTGGALAKGHDQSQTEEAGADVGAETVTAAQTLGAALGNGTDQTGKERGRSGAAGRPR